MGRALLIIGKDFRFIQMSGVRDARVTGVVARLLQQHDTWTPAQVWSHLAATATHLPADLDPSETFNDSLIYISEFE